MNGGSTAPTRVRWRILTLLFAISVITYIDRVNISVTARQMMPALGLTELQMGHIFSAFVLGYALFQLPGGWLGDRWGARRVLMLAVLWWSAFTALTAMAPTWILTSWMGIGGSLLAVRFLVGVGEAAALPNFNRAVANWLPVRERGLGIGVAIGGIGIGSALTPPVTAWIMVNFGWQAAFYVAALLGALVAAAWFVYATDRPRDHSSVNEAEMVLIAGDEPIAPATDLQARALVVPWSALVRTPTVWWLVISYSCLGYVAYIYMSWFYLYLVNVRGFGILRGALFASGPFIAITLFCPLGGWVTDRLVERYGLNMGRRIPAASGMALAGLSIFLGSLVEAPYVAIALLSIGAGWLYFTIGAFWSSAVDLSKAHAGTLSGIMNTGANIGGTLSPTLTPWLAHHIGWAAALAVASGAALLGGMLWMWIRPGDGLRRSASRPRLAPG
jgi:MFS transporter, ACS family, glucarate transporter